MHKVFNKILFVPKVGGDNVTKSCAAIVRAKKDFVDCVENQRKHFYAVSDVRIIESFAEADGNTIVIPVGGDGTALHAMKAAAEVGASVIGVNLGKVGFLTDIPGSRSAISTLLNTVLMANHGHDVFKEEKRSLLSVSMHRKTFTALNDFVVSDLYSDSVVQYSLDFGGQWAGTHKANGVIVATPTGSTAYAMNAGGAIIEPDLNVIEIIPIVPMSISSRPIIARGARGVNIRVLNKNGRMILFKADGIECWRCDAGESYIEVMQSDQKVTLLHYRDWNFFQQLSNKLNWA